MLSAEQVSSIERLLRAGFTGRRVARKLGHSRGTVRAVKHGRRRQHRPQREQPEVIESEAFHYPRESLRRCGKCGVRLTAVPCRACRLRLHRQRLFHVVESPEPLESRLEPAEAARLMDTLTMASGKIIRDRPKPRILRSRAFRFQIGTIGPVFYAWLHPPITVFESVEGPEPRVQSKGGAA
jgi:hypothetical protein